jgi:sortase A
MKELEYGIVRYPGSAKPGEKGNSFIFGHSSNFPWIAGEYNDVFSRLGQVEVGDIVFSYYGQKKYKYRVIEKKVVKPNDIGVLKNDETKKELTLMTCWPIGTTLNRLIIKTELIEE